MYNTFYIFDKISFVEYNQEMGATKQSIKISWIFKKNYPNDIEIILDFDILEFLSSSGSIQCNLSLTIMPKVNIVLYMASFSCTV